MDFCRNALRPMACASLLIALAPSAFAHYKANQLELILGYNNSSHSNNKIHIGYDNEEIDSLHETDNGNDFIGGVGYAYDILPWFVAYHGKDLSHSALQRVWVGLDLLFMNTTESGEVYVGQDPALNFYNFELEEDTARLMVNAEVDFNSPWKKVLPFVQASVGAARISAKYHDVPVPPVVGGGIDFSSEINYNLAYSLGAGLKFLFTPHFQGGVSYLYTDFGIVKTERDSNTTVLSQPNKDHLYTNSALVTLSYLF